MHRIMIYVGVACGLTLLGLLIYYMVRERWRAAQPVHYIRPGDPDDNTPPDQGKPHGHRHHGRHRNQI